MREVDPKTTNRAMSYEYYIDAPMPMVTIFKTMDVTHLVRLTKKDYSFNMLMCWCIARAAQSVPEFYLLPVGKKLMQYDSLGVNVIVKNKRGELSTCDIPFCGELEEFARTYSELTERCRESCENYELPDRMIVGTSALVNYDLDGVANFYSGIFNNPKPKLRPTTQANYESRIRLHIVPEIGKIPLNKLTQNDLQQFYARLKKTGRLRFTDQNGEGLSDRMVRMCHAVCRTALEKAMQDGLIRTNPAIGCKLPPKKAREMQVLDREELQRFFIQAQAEGYYELFLLDLATGLRRGELMALQWDDLDFKTGVLSINKQICDVKGELQLSTPKTKTSIRKLAMPPAVVSVLKEYRATVNSRWMFPSPVKADCPMTPCAVRKRLQKILEHAECKHVRFHDLRHTFATLSLQNGMDVKTLSAMLGHVSAATTLDIYTHITDDMRQSAAANIDRGIGKVEQQEDSTAVPARPEKPRMTDFKPYRGSMRKPGTGCISEINDHLFEGRYSPVWPDGKKHARNVYAKTREECEEKLKKLIVQMKKEIAAAKADKNSDSILDGMSKKEKAIAAYLRANPQVTNKALIATESGISRSTVVKYYDEIRRTMPAK